PQAPPVTPEDLATAEALVRRHLGFPSLREGQAETLARVLRGEDVLAIMPTGGGKSICYQLPGVLSPGVTLVVSPLLALMKDQLDGLPAPMRAAAVSITSELTPAQARRALDEVAQGRYRLVYAAPERLRQGGFLRALREAGVARLVVDEAHCVSVWGHDFRPDYLGIAEARRALGNPPVLALTATAPPRVARDILSRLGRLTLVRASVARPNLRFEAIVAKDADEKLAHLLALCRETKGPGVVYASSRAKCEQLAAALEQAGVNVLAYHAGLPDRAARQEAFMEGRVDVLVATVAFGMGVDKGDVRFVLHHDPATSLENYYQEAGRAGRDGQPARCVLLATGQDGGLLKQRARADLPSRDLLQRAWQLVLHAKDEQGYAVLDVEQVASLDAGDDVKPRVALSILAEAGAVERLADAPRAVRLRGREMGLFEAAQALGVAPEQVEAAALEAGGDTVGRTLLYRVVGDVSRVETVLERYAALAEQRAKEIMDYARTGGCRHAYLRRYFGEAVGPAHGDAAPGRGGAPPDRCGNCDNCLGISHEAAAASPQDDEAARRAILDLLQTVRGIGEVNLVWFLRGDQRTADWIRGRAGFGSLAMRSETRIRQLVRELESMGLVTRETLSHGGTTLKVTPKGVDASFGAAPIVAPRPAPPPARRAEAAPSASPATRDAPAGDLDGEAQARFEALRAWRKRVADEEGLPAYVVAHDATLRLVAQAAPATLEDLQRVKGMGPKKVEKYWAGILATLRGEA
ncbi:MAG TPA: ATP-dependent DNA helicase RecQ, partial [Candidatus Thermoplasmatota archaeon]|nr:ATP-dependent DNA helicase RecQ [Candidatus Thermoplasmatota archaeon]